MTEKKITNSRRCGTIAIVGRPNVGKSTLMNFILGQKLSITSRKPQTTRHQVVGIKTTEDKQFIYLDTPGLHLNGKKAMNHYLNRVAFSSLASADLVVFMVEGLRFLEEDEWIFDKIKDIDVPIILAINKVDLVKEKKELLPYIKEKSATNFFKAIVPLSVKKANNVESFEEVISQFLPEAEFVYPEEQITNRSERFFVTEIIREKITRLTAKELPYVVTVEIEKYQEKKDITHIHAIIFVEKEGQKRIIIGSKGSHLKEIGKQARIDIEKMIDSKVFLKLWVKVRRGWSDDAQALQNLGYK